MTRACDAFESQRGRFVFFLLSFFFFSQARKNIRFEWREEYLKIIVVERALEIKLAREFYIIKLGNFRPV